MGSSTWDPDAWKTHSAGRATMSASTIFTSRSGDPSLDPSKFDVRESRDSGVNPVSTPLIVGLDVTGSMGILAEYIAKTGLGTLFEEVRSRRPIPDPHVLFMGLGDVACDQCPVQATQFEADNVITDQIEKIWLEGHGGGNDSESYDAAWYFAATKTSCDAIIKRKRKGYLFTVGDEMPPVGLGVEAIEKFFGGKAQSRVTAEQALAMAQRGWEVFHVIIEEGNYARGNLERVRKAWNTLLPQRVISLSDHTKLSEAIVSALQIAEGVDAVDVSKSWTGSTSIVIANATKGLVKSGGSDGTGIVSL